VITVGVGVDHRADPPGGRGRLAQDVEHLVGRLQVEQCVDQ
jgi:hypothetical protein